MSRLPLPPLEQWTSDARETLRGRLPAADRYLEPGRAASPMPNVLSLFSRHPRLTAPWLAMIGSFDDACTLPLRDRELVILRVCWRTGCRYEWGQHARHGRAGGLTAAEVAAAGSALGAHSWSERDLALLGSVDQLVETHGLDDGSWDFLTGVLDEPQVLEVLFLVGAYLCFALVANSVDLEPDPGFDARLPARTEWDL